MTFDQQDITDSIRNAGVAGAGGAGFPSYVKWSDLDSIDYFLMNHQESEPGFYTDKWLGREYPDLYARLFDALDEYFGCFVIGLKAKDRDWCRELESATDGTIYPPNELPVDLENETGVVFAYTPARYSFSEEKSLLMAVARLQIGSDLPTEHGWIVHNTETTYNIARALFDGTPVTRKFVHVYGDVPQHRCLSVPIGTPVSTLLEAAGTSLEAVRNDDMVLLDGGPGWCYEIENPEAFGVRKRTNALLALPADLIEGHRGDRGQIDVREAKDWDDSHEVEPTESTSDRVRIPLITNAAYEGLVTPSQPIVEAGDRVSEGETIAKASEDGISIPQHASIDGLVRNVTRTHVVIDR